MIGCSAVSVRVRSDLSLSTFILSVGGTVVADTGAVGGSHHNVVRLATEQVPQRAVGAGAAAVHGVTVAGGCQSIAHCIRTGGPPHESHVGFTDEVAGDIRGRTGLWREEGRHQTL